MISLYGESKLDYATLHWANKIKTKKKKNPSTENKSM